MCGVAGRDNTKGLLTSADATSWRRALKIQVVKVSTDKAGDSEELGGVFAWLPKRGDDTTSIELTGTSAAEFAESAML